MIELQLCGLRHPRRFDTKLGYPVIDTDVHTNDYTPVLVDYVANWRGRR
jgi:hypothetical protein